MAISPSGDDLILSRNAPRVSFLTGGKDFSGTGWLRTDMPQVSRASIELRKFFSEWPKGIWDQWLAWEASRFEAMAIRTENLEEQTLKGRPIDWWKGVSWTMEERQINLQDLLATDRAVLRTMIELHKSKASPEAYRLKDSAARLSSQIEFLTAEGGLPVPPLLLQTPAGSKIIDGFHRIAALQICDLAESPQPTWVGRHG